MSELVHFVIATYLVVIFFILTALHSQSPIRNSDWSDFYDCMLLLGTAGSLVYAGGALVASVIERGWW
ncbi:MAG: hypothetical protein A3C93_06575 [Candidatus Lloydbacteria bacterium RIFCSPHIGHO2_02_FULL_54_17]|uniref:Uncharacterized protein n=1 Tax=Candidatus Lloydbacteria bacterium RIFCSPHIGHO2_02_FULL_54_17 TaxID=1798664 RepID=A0A1G2DC26_9BACT|nr:MAG: hypothetical protein A2762_05350 [Candidatus Lloydbacteria bacterium RIFCSPHIGHO2_01_FULL_54_11]OGZ11164.1 MAG: hypothetical protein A3C93_06575 [Candidatus Lloydbacteria bacterium RIFCSPHIGHO2_02_FULL_54_17]OGZ14981.1 MAG: hypothetical protein A2948_00845 [Candidatus Lloydbacteria bacterium RIFCSPLOWO2_01_FULL_54_18]OGZ15267.1 MAG: hypothetical protein A3H76_03245 [Candidatus Lloydbacteria bacterium RIFCSPLOWO2_02_FULL_54_12]